MVAFRGGSPLGGLASGWLITQVGSAPAMLAVNGVVLAVLAAYFLVRGHGIKRRLARQTATAQPRLRRL